MAWTGRLVALSSAGAALVLVIGAMLSSTAPVAAGWDGLVEPDLSSRDERAPGDAPLTLADLAGDAPTFVHGFWRDERVIVLKLELASLANSAVLHDRDTLRHAAEIPGEPDHRLVAYSSASTHLGCTVQFADWLGASPEHPDLDGDSEPEGRLLDPCHHAQYDVHNLGRHVERTPGNGDLWPLKLRITPEGHLEGQR